MTKKLMAKMAKAVTMKSNLSFEDLFSCTINESSLPMSPDTACSVMLIFICLLTGHL